MASALRRNVHLVSLFFTLYIRDYTSVSSTSQLLLQKYSIVLMLSRMHIYVLLSYYLFFNFRWCDDFSGLYVI